MGWWGGEGGCLHTSSTTSAQCRPGQWFICKARMCSLAEGSGLRAADLLGAPSTL